MYPGDRSMKTLKRLFDIVVVVIGIGAVVVGLWGLASPSTFQPCLDALKELLGG